MEEHLTFKLAQIDATFPRLQPDNSTQTNSNQSFDEKLKFAQARLGGIFGQFGPFFSYPPNLYFSFEQPESDYKTYEIPEQYKAQTEKNNDAAKDISTRNDHTPHIFESLPTQTISKQTLQQLLTQTGWLVPNMEASPSMFQAFLDGKLAPKLDMQSLIDQIAEQVKMVKGKGKTELSMTLKPAELGDILLTLTSNAGAVSIQIQATQETKKLIDAKKEELERALKSAKIELAQLKIMEVKPYVDV
ncbi:MAG: flagellar hook-length control protein FliK [bacterium]